MIYNKLVRDNIPDLIRANGETPHTRILDADEYGCLLAQKLDEEVWEFHRDQNIEELVDILEVVFALNEKLGYTRQDLMDAYEKKHIQRGGFRIGCI